MPLYIIAFVGFIEKVGKNKVELEIFNKKKIIIDINLIKIIILSLFSILLLFLIPSLTSAFVLGMTYLIVATVKILKSGEKKIKNILKLFAIPFILTIILLTSITTGPYIAEKILISFKPELDAAGSGWEGINRKIIINSANLFGEAEDMSNAIELFDEGTSEAFISILAHYGWIPSIILVATIILISIKLIINSIKVKDSYGKILIIGISCLFILQSIFNVLQNLNLWIEASFELPFVSYGGTGLIINIMCLALVLSIYRRKDIQIHTDASTEEKNYKIKIA